MASSKYSFELWSKTGVLIADLTGIAFNRHVVMSRNQPEHILFDLDLDAFEAYCVKNKILPSRALIPGSTEVRVRRLGKYLVGGQLVHAEASLNPEKNAIECRAMGFLWLFSKRRTGTTTAGFVSEVYTAENGTAKSRTDLAWALIDQSQALTNGDFGVTRGETGGSTALRDKQYKRTIIMNALQDMTNLQTDPIDIWFTHDKTFNTSAYMGSDRPDIVFEYPKNITKLSAPIDATDLTNEVIGLGQGAADGTQAEYYAEDPISQSDYQLRQDIYNSNATDNSDGGLTDGSEAELERSAQPIKIPSFSVDSGQPPFITDYGVGDRVMLKVNNHPFLSYLNGMVRVEKISLDIADETDEETVTPEVSIV
ncbi:hypothetical protein [Antrihabitans sp. YC2-6]|uniref:hypothetical protein n=1 Tax=Antrihabitans sp. YC2-6 TaxID=2799498 RepID=UPI0018F5654E|nr:hypothetical protein [Antrihabitans sp. YC2-6]MBJ8343933.1 hypothetical protein [Antrihabitans sp. YC2-6]